MYQAARLFLLWVVSSIYGYQTGLCLDNKKLNWDNSVVLEFAWEMEMFDKAGNTTVSHKADDWFYYFLA
jgi:hypothetical protein